MKQTIETAVIDRARGAGLTLPARILFGDGKVAEAGNEIRTHVPSARVFLVLGSKHAEESGIAARLAASLEAEQCTIAGSFPVDREPTVELVDAAAERARQSRADVVLACGGGSVIDTGKAVAGMATNPGSVERYLEGIGNRGLEQLPLQLFVLPTTAGTGSEATRNAVISVPRLGIKRSLRHTALVPRAAILDPELTWSSPPAVTAYTGMDALTQLLEACISAKRKPAVTEVALAGLPLVREALPTCYREPTARAERQAMSWAALLSGVCLANAGLGLVHGIASGLGALKDIPHGLVCAVLLPHVLHYNRTAAETELRTALAAFLDRPENSATIETGIRVIEELKQDLEIPDDFRFLALSEADLPEVAERSMGGSMAGNPVQMTVQSVTDFLRTVCL